MSARDLEYENNNIGYDEQHPKEEGGGIKCKNYEICNAVLPKWWWNCKGRYLCTNCHCQFGTWTARNAITGKITKYTGKGILPITDNIECPICFETKRGISQPNCEHFLCIDCFKRCYYGDNSGCPQFPYPDKEDEYFEDQDNNKWEEEYPLIKKWDEEHDRWLELKQLKYEDEKYLRNCPLCRT